MPTRHIDLTDRYDAFVTDQVTSGRFQNASEVMRAGLRLLELQTQEEQHKLTLLKNLATEGFDQLDQGEGVELHGREQIDVYVDRISQRASQHLKRRAKGA